jgi:hypothetical protein
MSSTEQQTARLFHRAVSCIFLHIELRPPPILSDLIFTEGSDMTTASKIPPSRLIDTLFSFTSVLTRRSTLFRFSSGVNFPLESNATTFTLQAPRHFELRRPGHDMQRVQRLKRPIIENEGSKRTTAHVIPLPALRSSSANVRRFQSHVVRLRVALHRFSRNAASRLEVFQTACAL